MLKMDRRLKPAAHVRATITDGEAVLLDLRTDEFIGLNEVASRIWEDLMIGKTVD